MSKIFFYGLYMDRSLLTEKGLHPKMIGPAVLALFFYCLSPNLLSHSWLVTTDLPFALGMFGYLYALWHLLKQPSRLRLIVTGLALGLALSVKHTALLLLPISGVVLFVHQIAGSTNLAPCLGLPRPQTLVQHAISTFLIKAAIDSGYWLLVALIVVSSILAVVYIWKIVETAYFKPATDQPVASIQTSYLSYLSLILFAAACLYFGVQTSISVGMADAIANGFAGQFL